MEMYIRTVGNGYLLRVSHDINEPHQEFVYEDNGLDKHSGLEPLKKMLNDIIDLVGAAGSRYDKERICVRLEPGDKYEDS